ncbi:MAG: hypothetical protein ISP01_05520 [Methanobrevibacter arboriphilus]|uniref:AbrB family transcriptional regulator n=1 Tax=Methanobrevibacter arboriphilus TaxID=39441 RepID=A0A843AMV7_METAZ|nr:hypothetical protein [Methanobrevibacter arboriphilus]MBF4468848.1 hypothetical protein [Methanobrevibacter arboriphilus]
MRIKRKTKLTQNKSSLSTTFPAPMAELLGKNAGDYIEWDLDIDKKGNKTLVINLD